MLLSQRCAYGLRAALYLAAQEAGTPVPVRVLSRGLGIPHAFLAKAVRDLVGAGVVRAQPGTGGGLRLARPAADVSLKEVVLALDGPGLFDACVLRLPGCGTSRACPLHEQWVEARGRIDRLFGATTLEAMARDVAAGGLDLALLGPTA